MMKIIIVDDDKNAANYLADKLSAFEGIKLCGIATNGMDGLRMMNSIQPDLMFLDIKLPDISGIEFLERANSLPQGCCRTVMFTAHERFMLTAFRNKAFDYLMKPVDDADLCKIIRRVCIEMTGNNTATCCNTKNNSISSNDNSTTNDNVEPTPSEIDNGIAYRNDGKFIVYTNSVDFKLVDIREIGVFTYNHDLRLWELTLSNKKSPVRLKRNVNSDLLLSLNNQLVRVSQKHIINIAYLMEVTDNTCQFYPPFDNINDVKVGRLFRKKLIDRFCSF